MKCKRIYPEEKKKKKKELQSDDYILHQGVKSLEFTTPRLRNQFKIFLIYFIHHTQPNIMLRWSFENIEKYPEMSTIYRYHGPVQTREYISEIKFAEIYKKRYHRILVCIASKAAKSCNDDASKLCFDRSFYKLKCHTLYVFSQCFFSLSK